ncbi:MAG: hypothetical protein KME07_23150 [Pegethrix bostrychoides GSE-TBD4-15B]|jgi:hypothetical protein|uniref:Uncharacterized protein n=1 Tax=Pegethrix bostrychoides GSE-TBD4-15B TaxID=2839662 RepID=A0A951PFZ2_9CYAN|nr:hypothetical protein [Pegethrix bostrychoides GSE-TBD4-15B]
MSETELIGIQAIDSEISVAGELSAEQLQQASHQGFKSVINLRMQKEKRFLINESLRGLHYPTLPNI